MLVDAAELTDLKQLASHAFSRDFIFLFSNVGCIDTIHYEICGLLSITEACN